MKRTPTASPTLPLAPARGFAPWPPRTVAIAVVGLGEERGPVGGCMVVRSGEDVGETPIRCAVSGARVVRSWLRALSEDYPSERDDVPRTYVTEGPEYERAMVVAEEELNRAICLRFEERKS